MYFLENLEIHTRGNPESAQNRPGIPRRKSVGLATIIAGNIQMLQKSCAQKDRQENKKSPNSSTHAASTRKRVTAHEAQLRIALTWSCPKLCPVSWNSFSSSAARFQEIWRFRKFF